MNILMIGDVVGECGIVLLEKNLWRWRDLCHADAVIVNGENASSGNGITSRDAERLFRAGADVITGGNHSFRQRDSYTYMDDTERLLRPVNFPGEAPGHGICHLSLPGGDIAVISLLGQVNISGVAPAFAALDAALSDITEKLVFVDFHAEMTGEKRALGYYADGRVTALCGTHTHVPTADAGLLPNGTAYITDIGMTGAVESVLGVHKEEVIEMLKTAMPVRFRQASGKAVMQAVLITADPATGRAAAIEQRFFE